MSTNNEFPILIYHNTFYNTVMSTVGIYRSNPDPTHVTILNNIGPLDPGNVPSNSSQFQDVLSSDESTWNLRLQPSSSAIDSGSDLTSVVPTDFDGDARPKGAASDMGAFESY
jgi:hypothetical protein